MCRIKLVVFIAVLSVHLAEAHLKLMVEQQISDLNLRMKLTECVIKASMRFFQSAPHSVVYCMPVSENIMGNTTSIGLSSILLPELMKNNAVIIRFSLKNAIQIGSTVRKSSNYVIQARYMDEFLVNLKALKNVSSWNPHARFLILTTSISDNSSRFASNLMKVLWDENVLDGILLQPNSSTTFHVYTWFPYKNGNCGKNFDKIELLDCCSSGSFQRNFSFFIDKIPKKFNNCLVKVKKVDLAPYVIDVPNGSCGIRKDYLVNRGLEIDILDSIAEYFNLRMLYISPDVLSDWGRIYENGTATGNLYYLQQETFDIAIGGYAKTYTRSIFLDNAFSYHQGNMHYCVPRLSDNTNLPSLTSAISLEIWCLIILVILVVSSTVFFIAKLNLLESPSYSYPMACIINMYAICLGVPAPNQPRSMAVRLMIGHVLVFSFFMVCAYQTVLVSSLTRTNQDEKIKSVQDIFDHKLKTYYSVGSEKFFINYGNQKIRNLIKSNWRTCRNLELCVERMVTRKDISIVIPRVFAEYMLSKYVSDKNRALAYCFKKPVMAFPVTMLMRRGFPFFKHFNQLIFLMLESGLMSKWKQDVVENNLHSNRRIRVSEDDITSNKDDLNFESLQPVFDMLLIGYAISVTAFVLELIYSKL